jgi:hypothetical protein
LSIALLIFNTAFWQCIASKKRLLQTVHATGGKTRSKHTHKETTPQARVEENEVTMINVGNHRHVPDIMFFVHNSPQFI